VLVLGIAYKRDIDDMRESPALDVISLLEQRGATVRYHDPHVPSFRENGVEHVGVALTADELGRADVVVVVTDHTAIDWRFVVEHCRLVVDTRNATAGVAAAARARIVSLADAHSRPVTPGTGVAGPVPADDALGLGAADPMTVATALAGA
jgi:UDP-N-acetyl-D-glucosamine dehydrogenase